MTYSFVDITSSKFSVNGRTYFKTFIPVYVDDNTIRVVNIYDSRLMLIPNTEVSEIEVDGTTYANATLLINAIHDVIYNLVGGVGGSSQWGDITGTITNQTDLINYINSQLMAKPVEDEYDDIADLLANQGSQTEGYLQKVIDASADPDVVSGIAYYEKLASTTGTLATDYDRLSDEEVTSINVSDLFTFRTQSVHTVEPTYADPGFISVHYEDTGDTIVSIMFDRVFSLYLSGLKDANESYGSSVSFSMTFFNTTIGRACSFKDVTLTWVGPYMKMVAANSDVELGNFNPGDFVKVLISAYSGGLTLAQLEKLNALNRSYDFAVNNESEDLAVDAVVPIYTDILREPFAGWNNTRVTASAPDGDILEFEIYVNGVLKDTVSIDSLETDSADAATPSAVIGAPIDLVAGDKIEVFCTNIGSTTAGGAYAKMSLQHI